MPERLPAGTVTLLFTDIEGSTRLLHELGDQYAEVLAEHRRVLREAFAAHGGVEVDTQGDAFFVAFARASDALAAAHAGQGALEGGPVRVRMGVHTGEPTVTDEGYVGADVHLAARVVGAGHGGQVLVSEATARLVEAELRDLGEHGLKDIERPVRLFQFGGGRFPPLKTLNNSNLPLPQTPLLGRKKELADVLRLLRVERARLVTVTGPGGIGKTRFALEAAHELVEEFAHGVWFVDLSALRDPALVVPTIASTLGAKGELAEHVADKELLLVLDNFEQVVEAAVDVADLLRRCANVQLLVTSREPLHVAGERSYPLRPLAESPAVELFRERAEAANPDFDASWRTLTTIVDRLDRLPLAVELAAARVNVLGADELLRRLEQRLPLLTRGARDLPARQRTLRATIEWSYELLSPPERSLFGRLGAFSGGWTLASAEAVCDADVETLHALVDKSLVRFDAARYSMLATIREFAAECLAGSGDADATRERHAHHFARLSIDAAPELVGPHGAQHMAHLEEEHANVAAALAWIIETDASLAVQVCSALWRFWWARDHIAEGRAWLARLLGRGDDLPPVLNVRLLALSGRLAWFADDQPAAEAALGKALHLARRHELDTELSDVLVYLGSVRLAEDPMRAKDLFEEALQCAEHNGARWLALQHLGDAELELGRIDRARAAYSDALDLAVDDDRAWARATTLAALAAVELRDSRAGAAERLFREALGLGRGLYGDRLLSMTLAGLAATAGARGDAARAGTLWGAVLALEDRLGSPEASTAPDYTAHVPTEDEAFVEALDRGAAMAHDEVVAYALVASRADPDT